MMSADDVRKPRVHMQLHGRGRECSPKVVLSGGKQNRYPGIVCKGVICGSNDTGWEVESEAEADWC